jgi:uncharacterized protein (DUF1501 family)
MCNQASIQFNRRDLMKTTTAFSMAAGVASFMRPTKLFAAAGDSRESHYFLHVNIAGGLDVNYLFDTRPLDMTAKGLITNYHGKEPVRYTGKNGQSTLRTTLTDPLMKWSDHFSIINGVVMSPTFQGHDQLANMLLTGNPFGGESFIPFNNQLSRPLDFIQSGTIFANILNEGGGIKMSPAACKKLVDRVAAVGGNARALKSMHRQSKEVAKIPSTLGNSALRLAASTIALPDLAGRMKKLQITAPDETQQASPRERLLASTKAEINMVTEMMRAGITDSGVIVFDESIDSHDPNSAQKLPVTVQNIIDSLAIVFEHLSSTQSPSGRSMLEDTTILIGSEFSRTMRQSGVTIDKSGTDHNPLTNTFIVAGKGIKGGLVLGQSDCQTADEVQTAAHDSVDPSRVSIMGRPFDFAASVPLPEAKPSVFDHTQYISAQNVVNAVQDVLDLPKNKRFALGRNLPVAPSLQALLA